MKKIYSLLLLLACMTLTAFAQTSVQGVPRSGERAGRNAIPSVKPTVCLDSIKYWVGQGINRSALVVKWSDGKGNDHKLAWGYKWNDKDEPTGEDMLRAVAKADPRFYMLLNGGTQYGAAIGGLGFDVNGNGNIALVKDGVSYSLTDGVYNTTSYDFDSWKSNDSNDYWYAGWYNGYWSYWTTDDVNTKYDYSSVGASSRKLTEECIDGWSYISDMENWYSNDMTGDVEYVSAPVSATRAKAMPLMATSSSRIHYIYRNDTSNDEGIQLLNYLNDKSTVPDGDTIMFRGGCFGKKIEFEGGDDIGRSLTIIGNGVIFSGESSCIANYTQGTTLVLKDIVFDGVQNPIIANNCNLIVENCKFCNCVSRSNGCAIYASTDVGNENFENTVTIKGCLFENNYASTNKKGTKKYSSVICFGKTVYPKLTTNIISCSFVGNRSADNKSNCIYYANGTPAINVVNCAFEGNYSDSGAAPEILFNTESKSLGYNVIHGTVSDESYLASTDVIGENIDSLYKKVDDAYQVLKTGKLYKHLPANTQLEGIEFPYKDAYGAVVNYTAASNTGAIQQEYSEGTSAYTDGVFILNEDWYGHQNSTINFLTNDGEWVYRVVQKENEGVKLGCTAQYGQIYGDKFYIMSKQAKDPGDTITGGRINIFDAKTMKLVKQMENIAVDSDGKSNADGRGFLGVDEHKGYVGSSNGIYVLNLDTYEVQGQVEGSDNSGGSAYAQLYSGQVGNMIRVNDRVFAVHQKQGLLVIDANTDKVEKIITAPGADIGWGFGSVVLSKDGNLWLSVAAQGGSGLADNKIVKINPNTLEGDTISLPDGIYGPANSWYAWTPDCFCASNQQNALYWNGGSNSWFSGYTIYKYDIDNNKFSTYLDFTNDADGFYIYGCSFRIDPVTDNAYVSLFKGFQDQTYVVRKYDAAGTQLAEYPMISNYWFPSLPVFPDNADPIIANPVSDFSLDVDSTKTIDLSDLATDADNFQAGIVKTVKAVSDAAVLDATMKNGQLIIAPKAEGTSTVTLQANSNGKLVETEFTVTVTSSTGISEINTGADAVEVARFTVDGRRISAPQSGINIIRMSDGTVRRVLVR